MARRQVLKLQHMVCAVVIFATFAIIAGVNYTKTGIQKQVPGNFDEKVIAPRVSQQANLAAAVKKDFQLVKGLNSPIYVYSALWRGDNVRLVVIKLQMFVFTNLYCVFLQGSSKYDVKATVRNLNQMKKTYTSAAIICPITKKNCSIQDDIPLLVGVVEEKNRSSIPKDTFMVESRQINAKVNVSGDWNKVSERTTTGENKVEFTVCVPAMFDFGNAALLVEKIEMSRLLGAGRVVLYNNSIDPNVDAVLRWYIREWEEGRDTLEVVVHSWKLPRVSGQIVDVPYYAQLACIDDCLHRYRWTTKYTEFSDLDELIIPLHHKGSTELLSALEKQKPGNVGFMFRSTVFVKDRPMSSYGFEEEARQYRSNILGHIQRENRIFPPRKRSKLIVNPLKVEEMGIHFIWEASGPTGIVSSDQALLYHYSLPDSNKYNLTIDATVSERYGRPLVVRLKNVWSKLKGVSLAWGPKTKIKKV